jgi:hypothetical protein
MGGPSAAVPIEVVSAGEDLAFSRSLEGPAGAHTRPTFPAEDTDGISGIGAARGPARDRDSTLGQRVSRRPATNLALWHFATGSRRPSVSGLTVSTSVRLTPILELVRLFRHQVTDLV